VSTERRGSLEISARDDGHSGAQARITVMLARLPAQEAE